MRCNSVFISRLAIQRKIFTIVFPIPSEIAQGVKPFGISKAPGNLNNHNHGKGPRQRWKIKGIQLTIDTSARQNGARFCVSSKLKKKVTYVWICTTHEVSVEDRFSHLRCNDHRLDSIASSYLIWDSPCEIRQPLILEKSPNGSWDLISALQTLILHVQGADGYHELWIHKVNTWVTSLDIPIHLANPASKRFALIKHVLMSRALQRTMNVQRTKVASSGTSSGSIA